MKRCIRRIHLGIVTLIAVLAISGGVYESVARRRAAREFPAPGKLVDRPDVVIRAVREVVARSGRPAQPNRSRADPASP